MKLSKNLSNASKQILLSLVKIEINDIQSQLMAAKKVARFYYEYSDSSSPEDTALEFKILNSSRDDVRRLEYEIKKLASVSKNLKQT